MEPSRSISKSPPGLIATNTGLQANRQESVRDPARSKSCPIIQTKLQISSPGDLHEQEADRVAEQVMRMPKGGVDGACACGGGCPNCAKDNSMTIARSISAKSSSTSGTAGMDPPPIVKNVLSSQGRQLDQSARSFFEPRFGTDLSGVRIHTDSLAANSASAISARAYTSGQNIVFGAGEYDPVSFEGKSLLAHELTHVQQQKSSSRSEIDRFPSCKPPAVCPPRAKGEIKAAGGPMAVENVSGIPGILISNYNIGHGNLKSKFKKSAEFAQLLSLMRAKPNDKWEILGFTDCDGTEATNTALRQKRATALNALLPTDVQGQITKTLGASTADCMGSNATAAGRAHNRSAFLKQAVTSIEFPAEKVSGVRPAPNHLYGVTSPASEYFVRTSPNGEIIGQLALREMKVEVIGESGTNVDNLWLKIRFKPADMAIVQATYALSMQGHALRMTALQADEKQLNDQIKNIDGLPPHPSLPKESLKDIYRKQLIPISEKKKVISQHQGRLISPYKKNTAWIGAAALGVVAIHYDSFLTLVDAFDKAHNKEPLRDRLTRLRQIGEDASLEGDLVVGTGSHLKNKQTQNTRTNNPSKWELLLEAKQIRMPDGKFIDAHHFILGLDALALPPDKQSSNRVLRSYVIASVAMGESWSAATWSGDVGGAVGDYILHKSKSWEKANTDKDTAGRRKFYFETRAPDMDLLADIDSWGAFSSIPKTPKAKSSFSSLRQIIEATYGPAGQTTQAYLAKVKRTRRAGVVTFLCHYKFNSPKQLISQTAARKLVLAQVTQFATAWYDARAGGSQPVFGRKSATDAAISTASGQFTDIFLEWLERLATTVGLSRLACTSGTE